MSKTLSIIVPTYNRADLLERLLRQLLAQTELPSEVIIIDDHSTDHTREVARNFLLGSSIIRYALNDGHHLADARRTGMRLAKGEYLSFIDDDVVIKDRKFLAKLYPLLNPWTMIQPKVIMENFEQRPQDTLTISDVFATRPYPILELITAKLNRGHHPRRVFPFNELGVFWHKNANQYWVDDNLIGDAYGQSYSTALSLRDAGIQVLFRPELVLWHPGAPLGGSKKFNKKLMTEDFTPFHYDYFYNMVHLNARAFPGWVWLWLPYFFFKSLVALAINKNMRGWKEYALKSIFASLRKNYARRARHGSASEKIFVWQGGWQGGAERITLEMAYFLNEQGIPVTLGVYQRDSAISLPQIDFGSLQAVPRSFRPLVASLTLRLRHSKKFTAIYSHKIGWWKTQKNKVFIHEAADLRQYQANIKNLPQRIAATLWRWLYVHFTLRSATIIFAATEAAAKYLRESGIPAHRIKRSASFYDENIFQFMKRATPRAHIHLLFIGNPHDPRKNFSTLRQQFAGRQDVTIHIAGGEERKSDQYCIYHGYVSPSQLAKLLAECHVAVFPAEAEGFSIALLEALATGIPCLALAASVNKELIGSKNLIIVPSASRISAYLQHALQNYAQYNVSDTKLARFSRARVLQQEYRYLTAASAREPAAASAAERKAFSETG